MNNVNMANMGPMGGPVGGPPMMNNSVAGGPQQVNAGIQRPLQANQDQRYLLNTYIYEYFLRYQMYDCARAILNFDPQIKVQKDSPGSRRDENGNVLGNGLGDDHMDTDNKDDVDQKRPDDLPAPQIPSTAQDSSFLYEWFCLFWEMLNSQKGKTSNGIVGAYMQHAQAQQQHSRRSHQQQQEMLRHMNRPEMHQQNFNLMRNMPNGMNLNMAMKPGQNPLPRAAMANSQNNPQAMHMLQKGGQMQRDPSDMDGNRARPASPGSNDNAPSPSKRPRLEGGPFNQANPVMMPNGRPAGQGMPGQQVGNGPNNVSAQQLLISNGINPEQLNHDQLQAFSSQNPHVQAKSIATYAANLQQHHGSQMPNKAMPNVPGPQNQGSPMVPQGSDPTQMANFYNAQDMGGPAGMRAGANGAQAGGGSNHALQDYQMQLMLLEQQNKKRLMMARQEQDITGGAGPRVDGPGGPGGPGGPNAPGFQGTSPQGGRSGASPNPADQMKRGNPQLNNAGNMGSPAPDGAHSHNSPANTINFIGGNQMDPMNAPHFYKGMNGGMDGNMAAAAQMNGNMRPPNAHPGQPFNPQMNPQQMMARQQQQAGQGGAPMNWQAGMNGQPMPPQAGQPPVQGGAPQRSMPPPSAPAAAGNNGNSRNATSSPQTSTAAPPTPSQANKAAPKKKDTKNAKSKAAAQKKANANANTAATPAAEPAAEPEAPAPATPITPVAPQPFNSKASNAAPAQMVTNGQAAPAPPAPAPVAPTQVPDPTQAYNMDAGVIDFSDITFAQNPLHTSDVLNDFDFDSFLHDGTGDDGTGFDFNTNAYMEGDGIGAD